MTKAIKKEPPTENTGQEIVPTKSAEDIRREACATELGEVLERHNIELRTELVYSTQAIVPRIILVDTTLKEEDGKTETPETTKED